jgi:UDP-N-acetylglucosamine 2-epimerase (non-hydrolysing)
MMKVMTILGTRPEVIRLSRVIAKLEKYMDHILVHTGQNYDYDLNEIFFDDLKIKKPNYFLDSAGKTPAETVGRVISRSDKIIREEDPDAILILGDTNSCLASYSAKRLKVPVFHMEAGNRCFDQRVPEEINRRLIDHISDINLPYSTISRNYLIKEGISPDRIIKTGSPLYEVLDYYMSEIDKSKILYNLNLKQDDYFLVSAHREENIDDPVQFGYLINMLNEVSELFGKRIIVSTHPRTKKKMNEKNITLNPLVELLNPQGFFDYVKLQIAAKAVFSDSGTITEESSILNFPAINIRNVHERPEGMEEGAVMLTGLSMERIKEALIILQNQPKGKTRILKVVDDYKAPNVSEKVIRIILSYTNYVNMFVYHKNE